MQTAQGEPEGRFSRAITMMTNSRNELRVLPIKVSSGLTSLQISASRASARELPEPAAVGEVEDEPMLNGAMED